MNRTGVILAYAEQVLWIMEARYERACTLYNTKGAESLQELEDAKMAFLKAKLDFDLATLDMEGK